jgi:hypothetical protein
MTFLKRYTCYATVVGLAAVTGAYAQITTVNSAVVTPRVFNDVPGAAFGAANGYPNSIWLEEAGVSQATGYANRDVWQFSNGGTTAYQFQNNDYFQASFDLTLAVNTLTVRREAGFLFSTASSGDIQFIVDTDAHEVVQFGGISFYSFSANNGITYNSRSSISLAMAYFLDASGNNALQFRANGVSSPVYEFPAGTGIGNGITHGGYFQIVNDPTNPNNMGNAGFEDITLVPEPSVFALLSLGLLPLVFRRHR